MSEKAAGIVLDPAFLDDFGQRWLDAWNRHDGEALAVLCTEDVEFFDPAIQTIHGRAAVADWLAACARWFPDYRFEDPEPPYAARDRAEAILPWMMIEPTGERSSPLALRQPAAPSPSKASTIGGFATDWSSAAGRSTTSTG